MAAANLPDGWVPMGKGIDFSKVAFPPSETKHGGSGMPPRLSPIGHSLSVKPRHRDKGGKFIRPPPAAPLQTQAQAQTVPERAVPPREAQTQTVPPREAVPDRAVPPREAQTVPERAVPEVKP